MNEGDSAEPPNPVLPPPHLAAGHCLGRKAPESRTSLTLRLTGAPGRARGGRGGGRLSL